MLRLFFSASDTETVTFTPAPARLPVFYGTKSLRTLALVLACAVGHRFWAFISRLFTELHKFPVKFAGPYRYLLAYILSEH
jgi:hypothetical protein